MMLGHQGGVDSTDEHAATLSTHGCSSFSMAMMTSCHFLTSFSWLCWTPSIYLSSVGRYLPDQDLFYTTPLLSFSALKDFLCHF